jgi:hypothetical protein
MLLVVVPSAVAVFVAAIEVAPQFRFEVLTEAMR